MHRATNQQLQRTVIRRRAAGAALSFAAARDTLARGAELRYA
jgi:hypothetical protein